MDYVEIELTILLLLSNLAISTWIITHLMKNRLKTVAFTWASEFKNLFLTEIAEKPETIIEILGPALKKLAKQYGIPEPGTKGGVLNLFGFKIPREILDIALPLLGNIGKKTAEEATAGVFG